MSKPLREEYPGAWYRENGPAFLLTKNCCYLFNLTYNSYKLMISSGKLYRFFRDEELKIVTRNTYCL